MEPGSGFFEGFPQMAPPFLMVKPFPVKHDERYVPPESDVIRVLAEEQDLVMRLPRTSREGEEVKFSG